MSRMGRELNDFIGKAQWDRMRDASPTIEKIDQKVPRIIEVASRMVHQVVDYKHNFRSINAPDILDPQPHS